MAVHWDATDVEDWDNVEPALKTSIDFILMGVGFGHITEANVEEVFRRTHILEQTTGAFRVQHGDGAKSEPVYVTPAEIRQLVGYRINVSQKTKAQFKNDTWRLIERRVPAWKVDA